ncbi:MAG: GNAT family protein [Pseudomonadota bacterium]
MSALPAVEEVRLGPDDIGEIYALYLAALSAVPNPAAVRVDDPSMFAWVFDVGGTILGLRDGEGLFAYGVVRPERAEEHDRHALSPHVAPDAHLLVLDGSAVRPTHWTRGFQREIIRRRIAFAGTLGASHVIAKASPGNYPSMRNLLKTGFAIVGLIEKPYGWRYIHHRPVAAPRAAPTSGIWIEAGRTAEAVARFGAGEGAFACHMGPDSLPHLRFGPL